MEPTELKHRDHNARAADVLRRLDAIGAINLDVMVAKSKEIGVIAGMSELEPWDNICYPFMVRIGPRLDFDIVSVAEQVKQLGFELKRTAMK